MLFIKKKKNSFVEKSGTVTKVKLVTKIEKHNQPYFGTLVLAPYFYCEDNAWNTEFFQNTGVKESSNMTLKKSSE